LNLFNHNFRETQIQIHKRLPQVSIPSSNYGDFSVIFGFPLPATLFKSSSAFPDPRVWTRSRELSTLGSAGGCCDIWARYWRGAEFITTGVRLRRTANANHQMP